ncbi:hypothetical protein HanIR_Chr09g0445401 [Helianthus annuus]|nr:hypothetical protein HanIR_Chr09g0445401 [Helianthus annuus]
MLALVGIGTKCEVWLVCRAPIPNRIPSSIPLSSMMKSGGLNNGGGSSMKNNIIRKMARLKSMISRINDHGMTER